MIDFENYERVTVRHEDGSHSFMYDYNATTPPIKTLLDRLAELEDLIEKGKLVPMYSIEQDKPYGFWIIGFYKKDYFSFVCSTKQEAETKLKELMESDENE